MSSGCAATPLLQRAFERCAPCPLNGPEKTSMKTFPRVLLKFFFGRKTPGDPFLTSLHVLELAFVAEAIVCSLLVGIELEPCTS